MVPPMALEAFQLNEIIRILSFRPHTDLCVCLGVPDLLAADDDKYDVIPEAADSEAIKNWHHWSGRVLDTQALFHQLSSNVTYLDHAVIRGPETVCDLNTAELPRNIGLLIDPGTSEHIFNVGHLFRQIAQSVCVGGFAMHINPLNMCNHGFWNISPTAYLDFYEANGFQIEQAFIVVGPLDKRKFVPLHRSDMTARIDAPVNSSIFVLAKKVSDVPFNWPLQSKYRSNPTLRGK